MDTPAGQHSPDPQEENRSLNASLEHERGQSIQDVPGIVTVYTGDQSLDSQHEESDEHWHDHRTKPDSHCRNPDHHEKCV